jgi:hypothetical protein
MYSTLFKRFFKFENSFRLDAPGLETKYALEAAESVGAKIEYLGPEFDSNTTKRLAHETRMNAFDYLAKRF